MKLKIWSERAFFVQKASIYPQERQFQPVSALLFQDKAEGMTTNAGVGMKDPFSAARIQELRKRARRKQNAGDK